VNREEKSLEVATAEQDGQEDDVALWLTLSLLD
jgi:hypothetical protein